MSMKTMIIEGAFGWRFFNFQTVRQKNGVEIARSKKIYKYQNIQVNILTEIYFSTNFWFEIQFKSYLPWISFLTFSKDEAKFETLKFWLLLAYVWDKNKPRFYKLGAYVCNIWIVNYPRIIDRYEKLRRNVNTRTEPLKKEKFFLHVL